MSSISKIEWTDATWNPVRGCDQITPGCKNCYAKTFAERWRGIPGHPFQQGFDLRLVPEKLTEPLTWRRPKKIFVNSMSDLFHERVPFEFIAAVYAVMHATQLHTYQVLTKRIHRALEFYNWLQQHGGIHKYVRTHPDQLRHYFDSSMRTTITDTGKKIRTPDDPWIKIFNAAAVHTEGPLPNVWLGVSVENQQYADERIPLLLQCPATIRFLSCEPLLGPVDLKGYSLSAASRSNPCAPPTYDVWDYLTGYKGTEDHKSRGAGSCGAKINWVICGGESGPHARPMAAGWAQQLRDQCTEANVAFFFKQWGEWFPRHQWEHNPDLILPDDSQAYITGPNTQQIMGHPNELEILHRVGKKKSGRLLDGREWNQFPSASSAKSADKGMPA